MEHAVNVITANFSVTTDPPLLRKFGVMNSGLVPVERHRRDLALLDGVAPDSLRIDLCWGTPGMGWSEEPVQGAPSELRYAFAEMDELATLMNDHQVLPYWSYCYTPPPLQNPGWQSGPSDLESWGRVLHDFARHYRDERIPIGFHEVYNEPDLPGVFFVGTMPEYFQMYAYGSRGLKAGDPDARVGGPALANPPGVDGWSEPFLDFVEQEDLPLDFFSFHVLNPGWPDGTLVNAYRRMNELRTAFGGRERFMTTEVHVNEYHPYEYSETHAGGLANKHQIAARIFADIAGLLTQTDLTLVHWAQFMSSVAGVSDEGMGLVDLNGRRKAAYNAFAIYAMMPVDRRAVTVEGRLSAMASAGPNRASLVIWNETGSAQQASVSLAGAPFETADLRVRRIDRDHASYGDDPNQEELLSESEKFGVSTLGAHWEGAIPDGGVVYIELDNAHPRPKPGRDPQAILRFLRRYYPNRGTSSYADFDRRTWTARLGMGSEARAHEQIAIVVDEAPPMLGVSIEAQGQPKSLDPNSLLGLRVDYPDRAGVDVTSVLFHGGIFDANRGAPMPWGTQRPADRVVQAPDLSSFIIPVAEFAPDGWPGRVTITFLMQNTGPRTRAKIRLYDVGAT